MHHPSFNTFECRMYVTGRGMNFILPVEAGPNKIARLEPLPYEQLVDPSFRRLLAAFETVPSPFQSVQV